MTDPNGTTEELNDLELVDETQPAPPAAPEPDIDLARWEAFNLGIDHAIRMTGGLANQGHRRQMAQKAGIKIPGG